VLKSSSSFPHQWRTVLVVQSKRHSDWMADMGQSGLFFVHSEVCLVGFKKGRDASALAYVHESLVMGALAHAVR